MKRALSVSEVFNVSVMFDEFSPDSLRTYFLGCLCSNDIKQLTSSFFLIDCEVPLLSLLSLLRGRVGAGNLIGARRTSAAHRI